MYIATSDHYSVVCCMLNIIPVAILEPQKNVIVKFHPCKVSTVCDSMAQSETHSRYITCMIYPVLDMEINTSPTEMVKMGSSSSHELISSFSLLWRKMQCSPPEA